MKSLHPQPALESFTAIKNVVTFVTQHLNFLRSCTFLHRSTYQKLIFLIVQMFALQVKTPALTHVLQEAPRTQMFLREDGKGLNSLLWRVNSLPATRTHIQEGGLFIRIHRLARSLPIKLSAGSLEKCPNMGEFSSDTLVQPHFVEQHKWLQIL